jgi:hypothetical protein
MEKLTKEQLTYIRASGNEEVNWKLLSHIEALEHELTMNETVIGAFRISEKRLRRELLEAQKPCARCKQEWDNAIDISKPQKSQGHFLDESHKEWVDTGDNFHV